MSERIEFQEVPEALVGAQEAKLARLVCNLVARELGLGAVEVRWLESRHATWFEAEEHRRFWTTDGFRGMVRGGHPGVIFLRPGMRLPQLARTVAHECRHLHQAARYGSWVGWWRDQRAAHHRAEQEADAETYAARVARDLGF